jgi:mannose/fructose-specific phosphotransferase system component IIA
VIRIVIAAHASLAEALRDTGVLIAGREGLVSACGLAPEQSPEDYARALSITCAPDGAAGVLVLCDIAYGTPHRIALTLARDDTRVRVLSGVNLPMTLEALLGSDENDIDVLAQRVLEAARADMLTS